MIEESVREALVAELRRQAEARSRELEVKEQDGSLAINGTVNVDELVMAIVGSLAGGP